MVEGDGIRRGANGLARRKAIFIKGWFKRLELIV